MIDEREVEKIISACIHRVRCKRGSFYPDKNYGSLIRADMDMSNLLACIRQATSQLDGVYIKSVQKQNGKLIIDITINDSERRVETDDEIYI